MTIDMPGVRALLGVAVGAVALAAAACGGGGDNNSNVKLENVNPNVSATEAPAERPVQEIKVTDQGCDPAQVTIKARTRVVWKWENTSSPIAIMLAGVSSPAQTSGEYQRDFDQAGVSYPYQCGPTTGRIVVE
jgi:plastocyanin